MEYPSRAPYEQGADNRHLRGSLYLAGYAIECILKAYLIAKVRGADTLAEAVHIRRTKGEEIANILGDSGHNLTLLLLLTNLDSDVRNNSKLKAHWGVCVKWKSSWRYDHTDPAREDAEEFLQATRHIHDWVKARI